MKTIKSLLIVTAILGAFGTIAATSDTADAGFRAYRQRYSSWSYYPARTYYYSSYYYKPYNNYDGYKYHYCIYYPSQPRYVYYYNPYSNHYWGRYDLEAKGYSMLAEKDRKEKLADIPDSAFPKPAAMPGIPESEDGEKIQELTKDDLPKVDAPKDAPTGK